MIARRGFLGVLAGLGASLSRPAWAQTFPSRPIKIVVPFSAGGPTDVQARIVAERMSAVLQQNVIVEARPGGAGGTNGAKTVAAAEPDGYTLLLALVGTYAISPAIYKNIGLDARTAFAPVAFVSDSPLVMVVPPKLPVSTLREFVDYVKANPGKLSYASPGFGTQPHLICELLRVSQKLDIAHIPYKGTAPAVTDLITGQVHMTFASATGLLQFVQTGQLKAIVVSTGTRAPQLPNVQAMSESGFPELQTGQWSAIVAPAGTPAAVIAKLNAAINTALSDPATKAAFARIGAEPRTQTPEEFGALLASEAKRWADIVRTANIKAE